MDKYGNNGHSLELAQYETPFADITIAKAETIQQTSTENYFNSFLQEIDSPFSKTYEVVTTPVGLTPAGEEFVSMLGELNDAEFNNSLYELAAEVENTWTSKVSNEIAMGKNYLPFVTQQARDYLNPLQKEAESMIDRVAQHFSGNDLAAHSETDLEAFFAELPFNHGQFSPAQEQFLGGIFNKVKSVVKKGVDLAKKGISAVGKLMPINIVLNKIKGLVKPLLEKVLKFAIGKLPKNLQPHAQTLAKKFLNLESPADNNYTIENNEGDLTSIQSELDNHIAQLVFSSDEASSENLLTSYEQSFDQLERELNYENGMTGTPDLNEARDQFMKELKVLQPGESAAPAIERFLPAVILALQPVIKIAISIIGRQKVINFLAGLLAKLVSKYVPENVAQPLAASIIDIGMSAIGFETYETQQPGLAYEAIANTIQDTVQEMNNLDETTLGDQEALTMHLLEAFEKAAANNFPPQYIRPDLRKTNQRGVWVQMPRGVPVPLYKKFTHVYDTTVDPQSAAAVKTFRDLPLANFLKDKLGLDPSKPIQARVHVYEATRHTRLSRISKFEKLPGLNASQPFAWVQLHPLTSQAAAVLLKEPAMGKEFKPASLATRFHTRAGQRFYYLEIKGAKLRIPAVDHSGHRHAPGSTPVSSKPSQSGDIQGVINFIKSEIRLNYYFSEEDAKTVVEKLNKNDFLGAAISVRQSVRNVLNEILVKNVDTKVKIIHEAFPELYLSQYEENEGGFMASAGKEFLSKLIEKLVEKLSEQAYQAMVNYFKARAAEFKEAQAKPQDGVTVKIIWSNISGMSAIRAVINAIKGQLSLGNIMDLTIPNFPIPEIQIVADKKFD